MVELPYSKKLDLIIRKLHEETHKFGRQEWSQFADVMKKDIYPNDLKELLEVLISHRIVKKDDLMQVTYWLTPLGDSIVTFNNGFESKEKEEKLALNNSSESLKWGKKSYYLNTIVLLVSVLALLVSLCSLYINLNRI
jgi:DNA-binding HxlR family transcriptional regulator